MSEPGPEPDPSPSRPRRARVFVAAFAAGVAAVVVVAGVGLAAWDAGYDGRVLPGVRVGAVDLSGMDRATAVRALDAAFPFDHGRIVLRAPDVEIAIPYADVGRRADLDAMVDEALRAGRDGTPLTRAVGEVRQALGGTTLDLRMALDEPAFASSVTTALASLERAPVDASITMGPDGPVTGSAAPGRSADAAPVLAAALEAARSVDSPLETVIPVTLRPVEPMRADAAVRIAAIRAQRIAKDVLIVYGKSNWTIDAATVRSWVTFEATPEGTVVPVIDATGIAALLDDAAKTVRRPGIDASYFKTRGGTVIGVMAGTDGRQLRLDATVARITAELERRSGGDLPAPVRVAFGPLPPEFTTEEATRTAPLMEKLGAWTTWFPISDRNYFGANIWRPAEIINGTVLMPGKRFEWWSAIGPVTAARGFGPGGVIRSDHTDPTGATGGGMCSSSTTLFNAALRAGLTINARANHKYYINRYPLGLDATVSIMGGGVQTMSFTNDTGHQIYIRGIRTRGAGGRGYVTYEIWGIPDGRKVRIGRAVVTNVREATTREIIVDTLPHGVRKQTEYPSNGMTVNVTRVVTASSGKVLHRDTFVTHYVRWDGRIEVGR